MGIEIMKYLTSIILFTGISILMSSCFSASGEENEKKTSQKTQPVSVKVAEVEKLEKPIPVVASGVLGSESESKLSFKIGGIIAKIYVEEGQKVKAGQLLAELEKAEINAQVVQAQSGLAKAIRDLERAKSLYEDTVATLEQVQNATTAKKLQKQT